MSEFRIKYADKLHMEFENGLFFNVEEGYLSDEKSNPLKIPVDYKEQMKSEGQVPYREVTPQLEMPLTHRCNLSCTYCSFRQRMKDRNDLDMPDDMIDRSVQFYKDYMHEANIPYGRIDFGVTGEPFLRKDDHARIADKIRHIFAHAHVQKLWVGAYISNGTFPVVGTMLDGFCDVQDVSCDGPEDIHDHMRRDINGKGTLNDLLASLNKMTQKKPVFGVSAVLTAENLHLTKIFSYLYDELGFDSIFIKPVNAEPEIRYGLNNHTVEQFKEAYSDFVDYIVRQNHHDMLDILLSLNPEDYFMRYFYRIKNRSRQIYRCGCGKSGIFIDTDGSCYPCAHFIGLPEYCIGNIHTGLDDEKKAIYINQSVYNREPCRICWARYLCGGGCYYQSMLANGTVTQPDKAKCVLVRHLIVEAIRLYAFLKKEATDVLAALPSVYLIDNKDESVSPDADYLPQAKIRATQKRKTIPLVRKESLKYMLYDHKYAIAMDAEKKEDQLKLTFHFPGCSNFFLDISVIDLELHPYKYYDLYNEKSFSHKRVIRIYPDGRIYQHQSAPNKVEAIPFQLPEFSAYHNETVRVSPCKLNIELPLTHFIPKIPSLLGLNVTVVFDEGGVASLVSKEPFAQFDTRQEGALEIVEGEFDRHREFAYSPYSENEINGMMPLGRWQAMKPNVC